LRARLALWLIDKLRAAMAAREQAKSGLVCLMLPLRCLALEIGRRMASAGHLDSPEDALELALIDIFCWLRGYWSGAGARELAGDRSARRHNWLSEAAPDLITEEPDGRLAIAVQAPPRVPGERVVRHRSFAWNLARRGADCAESE
jgi:hypothetical protein